MPDTSKDILKALAEVTHAVGEMMQEEVDQRDGSAGGYDDTTDRMKNIVTAQISLMSTVALTCTLGLSRADFTLMTQKHNNIIKLVEDNKIHMREAMARFVEFIGECQGREDREAVKNFRAKNSGEILH